MKTKKATNKDLWRGWTPISVRFEDIWKAQDEGTHDPIWFALKRVLHLDYTIKVLRTTIQIYPGRGNKGMIAKLPWEAIDAIEYWDWKKTMAPFVFWVDFGI